MIRYSAFGIRYSPRLLPRAAPSGFVIRRSVFDILRGCGRAPPLQDSLFGVPCSLFSVAVTAPAQGRQEISITSPELPGTETETPTTGLQGENKRNGPKTATTKTTRPLRER
jgi:hypothetical protein